MRAIPFRPAFIALLFGLLAAVLAAVLVSGPALAQPRDWQPVERVETYRVTGQSGIDLYRSIGENGPQLGLARTIAHTGFELLWTRDYRPQPDGSCVLAVARPSLVITYTLPEASGLTPALQARFDRFRQGIAAHERVHGDHVVEMTGMIQDFSLGLSAEDDPGCQKVRARLQEFLAGMAKWRAEKARSFDQVEMGPGGNVERLILELVNP